MTKAKFLSIPRIKAQIIPENQVSLPVLLLSIGGVLNACSSPEHEQLSKPEPNSAPKILSISLGCDLITESVSIKLGDSAEFFLLVDDESPLNLDYVVEMQNPDVASVAVDSEGMLLVSGLTLGQTDLSVEVVDSEGLTDTIVVRMDVDL